MKGEIVKSQMWKEKKPYKCPLEQWQFYFFFRIRFLAATASNILYISAEFATYINYCRSLRFEEKPDYGYLRQLIRNLFHRQGFSYDYVFDWNAIKEVSIPKPSQFGSDNITLLNWLLCCLDFFFHCWTDIVMIYSQFYVKYKI